MKNVFLRTAISKILEIPRKLAMAEFTVLFNGSRIKLDYGHISLEGFKFSGIFKNIFMQHFSGWTKCVPWQEVLAAAKVPRYTPYLFKSPFL